MTLLTFILLSFAVYRLSTDLAWMDGPFGLFARMRGAVMQRYGAQDWRSEGVSCPICWAFWLALPVAFWFGVVAWLAVAGAAAFLARRV